MFHNKLVKTVLDATMLTYLATGLGWASKKIVKENLAVDPSSNAMNYVKLQVTSAITLEV